MKRGAHYAMAFFVGAVAAFDNSLTWIYADTIRELEQNPVGKWLLAKGGVRLFINVKAASTLALVTLLMYISHTRHRWMVLWTFGFQLLLFLYLNFIATEGGRLTVQIGFPETGYPFFTWLRFLKGFYL